mgnify:CR=1 FL=1
MYFIKLLNRKFVKAEYVKARQVEVYQNFLEKTLKPIDAQKIVDYFKREFSTPCLSYDEKAKISQNLVSCQEAVKGLWDLVSVNFNWRSLWIW